jgi:hypothetical protein
MNVQTRQIPKTADEYLGQLPEGIIRALRVLQAMSSEDRTELLKANELIDNADDAARDRLRDIVINVKTGPYGDTCPYCGR